MTVPPLPELLRHVREMPASFRSVPAGFPGGRVRVRAVVGDLWESLFGAAPPADLLAAMDPRDGSAGERSRLGWVLAAAHLLWHPGLRSEAAAAAAVRRLLVADLARLSAIVQPRAVATDADRAEELIRRVLRALDRFLAGESPAEAQERLDQVDSVARRRLELQAARRVRNARRVREQMARRLAEEAAARPSSE